MKKPYKIAVLIRDDFYIKAVSLTENDAKEITDELITCGFIARYSPHINSK